MRKVDVLVLGGSAAGIIAAVTGKSYYPVKNFLIIRKEKKSNHPLCNPIHLWVSGK